MAGFVRPLRNIGFVGLFLRPLVMGRATKHVVLRRVFLVSVPVLATRERLVLAEEHGPLLGSAQPGPSLLSRVCRLLRLLCRFLRLLLTFGPVFVLYPFCRWSQFAYSKWLRLLYRVVEFNGPAFVKFGQWTSTRREIFSVEYCQLFSKLHRFVLTHPWVLTEQRLTKNLGTEWRKQFLNFPRQPIGSGCVAQVYKADVAGRLVPVELREASGVLPVAIKVLHPGVLETIQLDLAILQKAAALLEFLWPAARYLNPVKCVQEFENMLLTQVDLRVEARNLKKFAENFRKSSSVVFPKVLFSSDDLLIETFEEGTHVGDLLVEENSGGGGRASRVSVEGVRALLKMIFVDNFVHGDLHPGNILVRSRSDPVPLPSRSGRLSRTLFQMGAFIRWLLSGESESVALNPRKSVSSAPYTELVFLDAGMTVELGLEDQRHFRALFRAVIDNDGERVGELLLLHAPSQSCPDPASFRAEVATLVQSLRRGSLALRKVDVSALLMSLFSVARRHRVALESNFVTVVIAVLVLEGLGRSLNPDLDILEYAIPYLAIA